MRHARVVAIVASVIALDVYTPPVHGQEPDQRWNALRSPLQKAAEQLESASQRLSPMKGEVAGQTVYVRTEVVRMLQDHRDVLSRILESPEYLGARDHVGSFTAVAMRLLTRPSIPPRAVRDLMTKDTKKEPLPPSVCDDCVTMPSAQRAFSYVVERTRVLASVPSILVTLNASSNPSSAKLELRYLSYVLYKETTTDNALPNVYRGRYRIIVERQGFKPASLVIDLFEDPGTRIRCSLSSSSASTPSSCTFGS